MTILTVILLSSATVSNRSEEFPFCGDTIIQFAPASMGATVLSQRDLFVRQLSSFDRQVRLQTHDRVTESRYLSFVASQVQDWNEKDKARVQSALQELANRIHRHELPLPQRIMLIQTTGREEAGAAYTRKNAIILPRAQAARDSRRLQKLLTHELFHIMSRHDRLFRQRMYKVVGFHESQPVRLPAELRDLRITNPDAPLANARIELSYHGRSEQFVPVLMAKSPYDSAAGGTIFQYLKFRLMQVREGPTGWQPAKVEGRASFVKHTDIPDFYRSVGRNTTYVIHPEEIMADNFVHFVFETDDLADPWIVQAIEKIVGGKDRTKEEE